MTITARACGTCAGVQLANEALDALIAVRKAVLGDQVLPDGHGIAATREPEFDQLAVRLAGA